MAKIKVYELAKELGVQSKEEEHRTRLPSSEYPEWRQTGKASGGKAGAAGEWAYSPGIGKTDAGEQRPSFQGSTDTSGKSCGSGGEGTASETSCKPVCGS